MNKIKNDDDWLSGFFMTLIGARRSGKSTLIKALLKNDLKKRFDQRNIFIMCPTIDLNDDFDEFKLAKKYRDPDPAIIYQLMDEQSSNIEIYGKKNTPEILIIFDDCADNKILRFGSVLDTLAVRGRHFKINVMVSSQRMSAVSRTARLNSDYFIVFSPYNFSEFEQFAEQYIAKKDRKNVIQKLQMWFDEPFNYVVIDNSERSQSKKIKLGFNEILEY